MSCIGISGLSPLNGGRYYFAPLDSCLIGCIRAYACPTDSVRALR